MSNDAVLSIIFSVGILAVAADMAWQWRTTGAVDQKAAFRWLWRTLLAAVLLLLGHALYQLAVIAK